MPTIEFRMDTTGIPHTYIAVNNGAGVTQMYGFAPAVPGQLWGKGHIYDEATSGPLGKEHEYDHTTGPIEVTPEQYNRAINEINNAINNPPYYNLPQSILLPSAVNQCATWANHIADVAGFKDKLPWGGNGWNPYGQSAWNAIDQYWQRNPNATGAEGDPFTGLPWPGVDLTANDKFLAARNIVIRRDPLVLDLDGDGLELVGASGAVLFDHNVDGIKTGTGWARPDDGFLVRDLNGNGLIDTGRELLGVDTIKSNGGLATDGFDALRDFDTNNDGQVTSSDTAFSELKVWRDLDQNGTTTANELFTLGQLGITSINTNGTTTGPQAGQIINNNQIALSSTFTQNGQTKTVGAIDLEANNFFTVFPPQVVDNTGTPIAITAQAQGLPQMMGSGMVRDMRAAANDMEWKAVA